MSKRRRLSFGSRIASSNPSLTKSAVSKTSSSLILISNGLISKKTNGSNKFPGKYQHQKIKRRKMKNSQSRSPFKIEKFLENLITSLKVQTYLSLARFSFRVIILLSTSSCGFSSVWVMSFGLSCPASGLSTSPYLSSIALTLLSIVARQS